MPTDAISPDLKTVLRRLKLSRMLDTLPERLVVARQQKMPHQDWLLLVLSDEASRREAFPLVLDTLTIDAINLQVSLFWRGSVPLIREHWTDLVVEDIDRAVDELNEAGVVTKIYTGADDFGTDERGVARGSESGQGPDIAWFRDPAGNVISVLVS